MKRIRIKLPLLILLSNTFLFVVITLAFNLLIPRFFVSDAERALLNEFYLMGGEPSGKYAPTYLSDNISYMFLDPDGKMFIDDDNIYNNIAQYRKKLETERAEIGAFCSETEITNGEVCTFRTDGSYYVLTCVDGFFDDTDMTAVMYINIRPFLKYTYKLDIVVFLLFIVITSVMSVIGAKTGKMIDTAREFEKKFFQNSSHELKTPLMSIQGYAESIQLGVQEPKGAASVILRESERMTKLVEELLYISKIDSNQLRLELRGSDIREIVFDCIRLAEPLAEKKNCQIVPQVSDRAINVKCDEEQLARAVSNIIVNAVYHCRNSVKVMCCAITDRAEIAVFNDEEPIPDDAAEHIFDRFYTGHKGGSGIGLSIAKEIVNMHGGSIRVLNGRDGISFIISLPKE